MIFMIIFVFYIKDLSDFTASMMKYIKIFMNSDTKISLKVVSSFLFLCNTTEKLNYILFVFYQASMWSVL